MEADKFAAILPVIVAGLINKIIEKTECSEDEAFESLYNSKLYTELEREATKLWTCSTPRLFEIYQNEVKTGSLELPYY